MARTSIEWTSTTLADGTVLPGYTFNPWWGCTKVSEGCANCYAEVLDHRFGGLHWGGSAPRKLFGDKHWDQPLRWNTKAARIGVRLKVFCASMADVFEDRDDLAAPRARLFELIDRTPMLDWLLLTKRPANVYELAPKRWFADPPDGGIPRNVWLGVTAENQEEADARIPVLRTLRAFRRFVSYEPALGPINWSRHLEPCRCTICGRRLERRLKGCPTGTLCDMGSFEPQIHWLIVGSESGPRARPMDEAWVRAARDAAAANGVAFFYKQKTVKGRKVPLPVLDGRQHRDQPKGAQLV